MISSALKGAFTALMMVALASSRADDPPPVDPIAQRKASAEAEQAEWNARKAKLDYENAAGPGSGLTNSVTVKDKAGSMEASLLMAQALSPIAATITAALKQAGPKGKIFVFPGDGPVDVSLWELFDFRAKALDTQFSSIEKLGQELDKRYKALATATVQSTRVVDREIVEKSAVVGMTAGLEAVSKAFSYFASDYEAGGFDLEEDDEILVSAVAAQKGDLEFYVPTQLPQHNAGKEIYETLTTLGQRAEYQNVWTVAAGLRSADLTKRATAARQDASAMKELASDYDDAIVKATAAVQSYTGLTTAISSTAADNPLPLSAIIKQKALASAFGSSDHGLFLTMYSANGGYYTKKNLWTAFGAMPFYASGGAVAHFRLIDRVDSQVAVAGVVSFACAYRKVTKVAGGKVQSSCEVVKVTSN
jgi:murein L,D-transpeptidase YcbB/YkuD